MKKNIQIIAASLVFGALALGCAGPMASNSADTSFNVDVAVPLVDGGRGLLDTVDSVTVRVLDSSSLQVGTSTLSKVSGVWKGSVSMTATGTMTFAVQAKNGANVEYVGNASKVINGADSLTITVAAKPTVTVTSAGTSAVITDMGTSLGAGAGSGWGATIAGVYANSDGTNLYIAADFGTVDTGNNIYFCVDVVGQTTGISSLNQANVAGWGAWGDAAYTFNNTAAVSFEAAVTMWRGGATANLGATKKDLSNSSASGTDFTGTVNLDQNTTEGIYKISIPYSDLGVSYGDAVKVYVFFGKDYANGGFHAAFPAMGATQISNMDNASGKGLNDIDVVSPSVVLY